MVTVKSVRDTRLLVEAIDAIADTEVLMNNAIVSVTDAVSRANADLLNGFTTGQVTLESVEDTNANILLIDGIPTPQVTMAAAAVKVTDKVNNAEVDTLDGKTTGKVTVDILEDTFAEVSALDALNDSDVDISNAAITVTNAVSKANADTLNGFTNAKVTLNSVEDNYANIQLIKDIGNTEVDMDAAAIKVTDDVNKTKVDDLRTDTTGDITLTSITEDKGDLATINGFTDVILSTANITVTDNVDKSEADTIDAYSNTVVPLLSHL